MITSKLAKKNTQQHQDVTNQAVTLKINWRFRKSSRRHQWRLRRFSTGSEKEFVFWWTADFIWSTSSCHSGCSGHPKREQGEYQFYQRFLVCLFAWVATDKVVLLSTAVRVKSIFGEILITSISVINSTYNDTQVYRYNGLKIVFLV